MPAGRSAIALTPAMPMAEPLRVPPYAGWSADGAGADTTRLAGVPVARARRWGRLGLGARTELSDTAGSEFIHRVQRYAKAHGLACRLDHKRGRGSHVTLYLGTTLTIVRNPKDELKTGTLHAMLKQLGLTLTDL